MEFHHHVEQSNAETLAGEVGGEGSEKGSG